jgi:hypothetical protein
MRARGWPRCYALFTTIPILRMLSLRVPHDGIAYAHIIPPQDGLDALREPRPPAGRVAVSPDTIGRRTGVGVVCQALRVRGLVTAARALRCVSDNSVRLQLTLLMLVFFVFFAVSLMQGVTNGSVMVVGLVCVTMSADTVS